MVILQGDVYWADLRPPRGSEPGFRHPCVVVQNNAVNRTGLGTVVVCVLTTQFNRAAAPGNVALAKGEANLPRRSVVNVTQVQTVDKSQLTGRIGTLTRDRLHEVLAGLWSVIEPRG